MGTGFSPSLGLGGPASTPPGRPGPTHHVYPYRYGSCENTRFTFPACEIPPFICPGATIPLSNLAAVTEGTLEPFVYFCRAGFFFGSQGDTRIAKFHFFFSPESRFFPQQPQPHLAEAMEKL